MISNFITESMSRINIRNIVREFRKFLNINLDEYIDVVRLLDILSTRFDDFSYEIVPNNFFPKKVFATTDIRTGHIMIKQEIYDKACDGDGFSRFTIAHEIGHFILLYLYGFKLTKSLVNVNKKAYKDPEWQAECFAGEFLMGYDVARNFSVNELKNKCGVSLKAARYQFNKFKIS